MWNLPYALVIAKVPSDANSLETCDHKLGFDISSNRFVLCL